MGFLKPLPHKSCFTGLVHIHMPKYSDHLGNLAWVQEEKHLLSFIHLQTRTRHDRCLSFRQLSPSRWIKSFLLFIILRIITNHDLYQSVSHFKQANIPWACQLQMILQIPAVCISQIIKITGNSTQGGRIHRTSVSCKLWNTVSVIVRTAKASTQLFCRLS